MSGPVAFASSPSACSKSFRPRLQLLHRNAGISLFNPLQPRRPFGVDRLTSAVVQSDSSNPTKTHRKPIENRTRDATPQANLRLICFSWEAVLQSDLVSEDDQACAPGREILMPLKLHT